MKIFLREHVVDLARDVTFEAVSRGDSYMFDDPDEGYVVMAFLDEGDEGIEVSDSTARQWLSQRRGYLNTPEEERHDSTFPAHPYFVDVHPRCAHLDWDREVDGRAPQCRRVATKWEQIGMTRKNFCDQHGIEVERGRL